MNNNMPRLMYENLRQKRYYKRMCDSCSKMFRPRGKVSRLCDTCWEKRFIEGIEKRKELYRKQKESRSQGIDKGGNNIS